MRTFELEEVQGLFEIVQANTFTPNPIPVIVVTGDNELLIVPLPETNDQVPVPTVALLAAISAFGLEIQTV